MSELNNSPEHKHKTSNAWQLLYQLGQTGDHGSERSACLAAIEIKSAERIAGEVNKLTTSIVSEAAAQDRLANKVHTLNLILVAITLVQAFIAYLEYVKK